MTGKVYLVGAGPGDPELLTRKAARILESADVVLHDSLVSREVLALANPQAELIDVGKRCGMKLLTQGEINEILVASAKKHEVVVRLKGGDPLVFGRAAEEIDALREAAVDFEIVPGITAALGAAAAAQISLTDRRAASQVLFTTFSRGQESSGLEWGVVTGATTLAIYMPGRDYGEVARRLIDAGMASDTPCAIVSHISGADQEIRWTNVAALYEEARLPAPALLIVGRVARRRPAEVSERILAESRVAGESAHAALASWRRN